MIYRALDHRFTIEAPPSIEPALRAALAPLSTATADGSAVAAIEVTYTGTGWRVADEQGGLDAVNPGVALARTLEFINQRAASSLVDDVPIHAAAVCSPQGGVVALAGVSGAGKSTLSAGMLQRGWRFLAEEVTAVDPTSRAVRAYHRPIGLRAGGAQVLGMTLPDDEQYSDVYPWPVPAAFHASSGRLIAVVLVERTVTTPDIESLRPPVALSHLIEHTVVPDDNRVVAVFRQLEQLVRRVPVLRARFQTLDQAAALLDQVAEAHG